MIYIKFGQEDETMEDVNNADANDAISDMVKEIPLYERLFQLRKANRLTQTEIANLVQTSYTVWQRWEQGKNVPSFNTIRLIAAAFGLTVDELLDGVQVVRKSE